MNKNSVKNFLCQLKTQSLRKHFLFEVNYTKMNQFLASFLAKEGFFRGFFLKKKNNKKTKIIIILKYSELSKTFFVFNKSKSLIVDKSQFEKQKKLTKCCNGLGIILIYTIKGFVSNETAFWLRLGGKKIIEII